MAVALAIEHELMSRGLQTVDGGLGQKGVGHEAEPLTWKWHTFV